MNDESNWKEYIEKLKEEGDSDNDIKKNLIKRGYSKTQITKLQSLNLLKNDKKRYLIAVFIILAISLCLVLYYRLIINPLIVKSGIENKSNEVILNERVKLLRVNPDMISQEEKNNLSLDNENMFTYICSENNFKEDLCTPSMISIYLDTKRIANNLSLEDLIKVREENRIKSLLIYWYNLYKGKSFTKEGFVSGYENKNYISIINYYYLLQIAPRIEKNNFILNINEINSTDKERSLFLLKTYMHIYKTRTIKEMPQNIINQSAFLKDLCNSGLNESGKDIVDVNSFCIY
jgi:hypothetical protein